MRRTWRDFLRDVNTVKPSFPQISSTWVSGKQTNHMVRVFSQHPKKSILDGSRKVVSINVADRSSLMKFMKERTPQGSELMKVEDIHPPDRKLGSLMGNLFEAASAILTPRQLIKAIWSMAFESPNKALSYGPTLLLMSVASKTT